MLRFTVSECVEDGVDQNTREIYRDIDMNIYAARDGERDVVERDR